MNPLFTRSAFARTALPLLAGVVGSALVTVLMIAGSAGVASSEHAAPTQAPRFQPKVILSVRTPPKKKIVTPKRTSTLLPVVNQKDILPGHRQLADRVLRALPSYCRDHLEDFYVNYDKNAANRGLGGESTIIIVGHVPDREFMALLVHECGHVTDLGGLRGTESAGTSSFYDGNTPIFRDDPSVAFYQLSWRTPTQRKRGSKDSDFVSGYASADPFEDFSETFAYFALQKDVFQKLAAKNPVLQAKYDFMEEVVFAGTEAVAQGQHVPEKNVPWDVTKLPYVWHAKP